MKDSKFLTVLMRDLVSSLPNWYGASNWDEERFGPHRESFKDWIFAQLSRLNKFLPGNILIINRKDIKHLVHSLSKKEEYFHGLSLLYELLQDEYSKSTLARVIAYRILGYRKIRLRLAEERDRKAEKNFAVSLIKANDVIRTNSKRWELQHYDFGKVGYPVECFLASPMIFTLRPYEYSKRTPAIVASPGDCVIDGGGCWGDTALYFAHLVGEKGRVYSFEFSPDNLDVFERNLSLNPQLSDRIQVTASALWDTTGVELDYIANGPSTNPNKQLTGEHQEGQRVSTITIDDFVKEKSIKRVDFIKMDIEGSELNALKGAEKTLRTYKPKLAICLYHSLDDFVQIPEYLSSLDLPYEFYLDHFTIHAEETILFAIPVTGV
jgi:FkbM family methyltransferase